MTVLQNLRLHAKLFGIAEERIARRIEEMAERFGLTDIMHALPDALPLGQRQRLSLAVMIHGPEMLILDEPTSGVDPVARDAFWQIMVELARKDNVTIFVSTHFMNEAERCDRISLMHAGQVLVSDTPSALIEKRHTKTLEEAFISYLEQAVNANAPETDAMVAAVPALGESVRPRSPAAFRSLLATVGTVLLMFVMGYGITLDVENLSFAVLDRDQTTLSHDYALNLAGSRYFTERSPIRDYAQLDERMRAGEISLAIEIPTGFARDAARGTPVQIGAWIDGAMPSRAETVRGYVQGIHLQWLTTRARQAYGSDLAVGVGRAHQGADRSAADDVRRDARLLQRADDADVRPAASRAAAEGETDAGFWAAQLRRLPLRG